MSDCCCAELLQPRTLSELLSQRGHLARLGASGDSGQRGVLDLGGGSRGSAQGTGTAGIPQSTGTRTTRWDVGKDGTKPTAGSKKVITPRWVDVPDCIVPLQKVQIPIAWSWFAFRLCEMDTSDPEKYVAMPST